MKFLDTHMWFHVSSWPEAAVIIVLIVVVGIVAVAWFIQ